MKSLRVSFTKAFPSNVIFGLWHQDLPACMAAFRGRKIAVMISTSRDGGIAARIAQRLDYHVFRGSSSRRALALRHLHGALQKGLSVGMAVDGPKGPALVAKPGAAWLAQATGRPLVMLKVHAWPALRIKSWDHTFLPLPFAKVVVAWCEPE